MPSLPPAFKLARIFNLGVEDVFQLQDGYRKDD